jgi:NADH-quinone oxidoreductase subunit J
MDLAMIFFLILAVLAIGTAVAMLVARHALYAALFLILNFSVVAFLYLTLGAPFIAMAQVSVYAGAIMVLFLFVIMLLGSEKLAPSQVLSWQRPLAVILSLIIVGLGVYVVATSAGGPGLVLDELPKTFAAPKDIGLALFTKYLLPFEVTAVILLVATIGAVVLTRVEKTRRELMIEQAKAEKGKKK